MKPYHDKETLRELHWDEGKSLREIGEKFGVSHKAISYWFEKNNLKKRGRGNEYPYARFKTVHEGSDSSGYEIWRTKHNDKDIRVRVHRLLAVSEYGFDSVQGMDVHHINGVKWDNRPENIELESHEEHARNHSDETEFWQHRHK